MGLTMLLEPVFLKITKSLHINKASAPWHLFCIVRTLFLVTIGRYFSHSSSLRQALSMLKRTALSFDISALPGISSLGLAASDMWIAFLGIIVLFAVSLMQEKGKNLHEIFERRSAAIQFCVLFVALLAIIFLGFFADGYIVSEFIYANV